VVYGNLRFLLALELRNVLRESQTKSPFCFDFANMVFFLQVMNRADFHQVVKCHTRRTHLTADAEFAKICCASAIGVDIDTVTFDCSCAERGCLAHSLGSELFTVAEMVMVGNDKDAVSGAIESISTQTQIGLEGKSHTGV